MVRAISFLLLASCAAVHLAYAEDCKTPCGMTFKGMEHSTGLPNGWSCKRFLFAEQKAMMGLKHIHGAEDICYTSGKYTVYVKDVDAWKERDYKDGGFSVLALTDCSTHTMYLNNEMPEHGSLLHEMMHTAQYCTGVMPLDKGEDIGHADWVRNGMRAAEQEFHEGESFDAGN